VREVKSMWVTVAPPSRGDLGNVVEAFWYLDGDTVTMCSESGVASGKSERLTVGGSDRAVASRLRRQSWAAESGTSDFNRNLNYSRGGVA
jgi:hypothetical protein